MISRLLLFPAIYGIIAIAGSVVLLILVVVIWCRCTRTRSINIKSPVSVKTVSNFCHYIKRNCLSKIKIAALKTWHIWCNFPHINVFKLHDVHSLQNVPTCSTSNKHFAAIFSHLILRSKLSVYL